MGRWADLPPGDPGRIHEEGRTVRDALETARTQVADLLGVVARQVVFTSGATEAINAAVWGATRAPPGAPVLCAAVEHSAVRDASARAAPTELIGVDREGRLDVEALRERLQDSARPRPALVQCQWGNHEVGRCNPSTRWSRSAATPGSRCTSTPRPRAAMCRPTSARSGRTWSA